MVAKTVIAVFAQVLFIQSICGQCIPNAYEVFSAYGPGASYAGCQSVAPTSGGGFIITSVSPITPNGVTVLSENAIEGAITVIGELPFLGAVALEGALPTVGAGGINYGCGNGEVAMVSEGLAPVGYPAGLGYPGLAASYGPGMPGYGYNVGYGGCGTIY